MIERKMVTTTTRIETNSEVSKRSIKELVDFLNTKEINLCYTFNGNSQLSCKQCKLAIATITNNKVKSKPDVDSNCAFISFKKLGNFIVDNME